MNLKSVLSGIEGLKAKGNLDMEIMGVAHDSRKVKEGYVFVAVKGYDVDDEASWEEYLYTCASEQLEEYAVIKVFYLYKDIVAMMRMLGWCIPIGCSFDEPLEKIYFANQISPDIINEAFKNIGKDKVSENCVKDLGDLHIKEEQDTNKGD